MSDETVLVTGAAGTVGTYVVRELTAAGKRVIATDRVGCRFDLGLPPGAPVEIRPGDLTDLAFCVDVTAGADAVIHTAATIDLALPEAEIRRINVDAVRFLYEAARARGARRFVFLSSGAIYRKGGHAEGRTPITEATPIAPQTPYERSKADAEAYLFAQRLREPARPDVVVLRPSMIYGPRARFLGAKASMVPPLFAAVLGSVPRLDGGAVCNWVHGEDVARAAAFLLDRPAAAWEAFNVGDDEPLSFGDQLEVITRAYGLPIGPRVPVPARVLEAAAKVIDRRPGLLGPISAVARRVWAFYASRSGLSPAIDAGVDRETFLYATTWAVFDVEKLRKLGFRLQHPRFRDSYPAVLRWYQSRRWLPSAGALPPHDGAAAIETARAVS